MAIENVILGTQAPTFNLKDQSGREVSLEQILQVGPVLLVFYPGDFTYVCTKQLCNYRDNLDAFREFGLQIVGISSNTTDDHGRFAKEYEFPFLLLSDPSKKVAKAYGCTSLLMMGGISRAVFIIGKQGNLVYRYVEPTVLTRRKADELVEILKGLKTKGLL